MHPPEERDISVRSRGPALGDEMHLRSDFEAWGWNIYAKHVLEYVKQEWDGYEFYARA